MEESSSEAVLDKLVGLSILGKGRTCPAELSSLTLLDGFPSLQVRRRVQGVQKVDHQATEDLKRRMRRVEMYTES